MTEERTQIINYVESAATLAENLTRNLKSRGKKIDDETVVALAQFYKASKAMQNLLDLIEKDKVSLN